MKKQYTKKQICEAISYWKKQLKNGNYKKLNESSVVDGIYINVKFKDVKPDEVNFWSLNSYDWDIKQSNDALDIFRQWKEKIESDYNDNGFDVKVVSIEGPVHYDDEFNVGIKCGAKCDKEELKKFHDANYYPR